MKDPAAGTATPTGTTGSPGTQTRVPVIIEVINGALKCTPEHVVIFGGEVVEWVYLAKGHTISFKSKRPFGKQDHQHQNTDPGTGTSFESGKHDCADRELFKYTITVPGYGPLDPVVDADPRRRPPIK